MLTLFCYLKSNRRLIAVIIILNLITYCTFRLYMIWVEPFWAVLLVELLIITAIGTYDYIQFDKRLKILKRFKQQEVYELNTQLFTNPVEYELAGLFKNQSQLINQLEHKFIKHKTSYDDVFSLWLHQIKTPIASLNLMLEKLPFDEQMKMKGQLMLIENYAETALSFVRLESTSNDLKFERISVLPVLKKIIKRYKIHFIDKHIVVNLPQKDMALMTDAKWLSFILEQIISNAVKYTQDGQIVIKFMNDERKQIIVQDTGIGILAEDLPRIFECGYTGCNGRRFEKSTGIGLYLCKRTCDMLGLDIKITSKAGVGTKVVIG